MLVEIETKTIRALSWKQPYASLMLEGKIETRTWYTEYRGLVLICTSKQCYSDRNAIDISGPYQFLRLCEVMDKSKYKNTLDLDGYAIAVGSLFGCRYMTHEDEDKCFVKYSPKLYCHIYENIIPIEPFPWKGTQGWKTLTKEQIRQIKIL